MIQCDDTEFVTLGVTIQSSLHSLGDRDRGVTVLGRKGFSPEINPVSFLFPCPPLFTAPSSRTRGWLWFRLRISCRRPVNSAASGASVARRSTQLVATQSQARISRAAAPGSAATVQSTPARHVWPRTCVCLHSCVPCAVRQHDPAQAWFSALSQDGAWSPARARGDSEATAVVRHP